MKKHFDNHKEHHQNKKAKDFYPSDGSHENDRNPYSAGEYTNFLSNGMTDNEKVEAQEYYEDYLSDMPETDGTEYQ